MTLSIKVKFMLHHKGNKLFTHRFFFLPGFFFFFFYFLFFFFFFFFFFFYLIQVCHKKNLIKKKIRPEPSTSSPFDMGFFLTLLGNRCQLNSYTSFTCPEFRATIRVIRLQRKLQSSGSITYMSLTHLQENKAKISLNA